MIRGASLSIRRGTQLLLEQADLVIHPGERAGLVGRNGSGKSTLFAVLLGQLDTDGGEISIPGGWRMASVAQSVIDGHRSARDYVIDGDYVLRALERERELAQSQGASGQKIAELEMALEQAGAWQANSRAETLLAGLGFNADQWSKAVQTFSGGWQMRIALARALMADSDLLLLDEPTNHLDLDAMIWLERWLANYDGTVVIISHDSEFLDAVCNTIIHIEHRKLHRYKGNYESFLTQRAERLRQTQLAWERQTEHAARLQQFIDRFKAKASKAKQAQSRVKALARMQALAPLHAEAAIDIGIPSPQTTPDLLLTLEQVSTGYETAEHAFVPVLEQINVRIQAGERIGVLGVNGAGKSTLIKLIAGELPAVNGQRLPNKHLRVGYFAQHQMDMLDGQANGLQHLLRIAPQITEQAARNYLAQFGFVGDRVSECIAPFSGGEKARLALALVVYHRPNLLILDEPSNHLDAQTRDALSAALAQYEGSLLLVSHDRHLLRSTVDQFWLVAYGTLTLFEGDLDDYRQQIGNFKTARTKSADDSVVTDNAPDRREQRRQQAQARQQLAQATKPLQAALKKLEGQLEKTSARLALLERELADPGFYQQADSQTRQQVLHEQGQLSNDKEDLEMKCLDLMEQIEALQQSVAKVCDASNGGD